MRAEWATTRRGQAGVVPKKRRTEYDLIRVMVIKSTYPIYTPREEQAVAYFTRDTSRETITIEMFGDNLAGNIDVTIGGILYKVDCQSSTAELRAAFGFNLQKCRVTAFPGLWEFAFSGNALEITAEPAVGDTDILTFSGGLVVTQEAWVSVADNTGRLLAINVVDAIPYAQGEVKSGSIATAKWSAGVGWVVDNWHCREFRFRVLAEAAGGVGDVVDGDGNPVDTGAGDCSYEWSGTAWILTVDNCTVGTPHEPSSPGSMVSEIQSGTCSTL